MGSAEGPCRREVPVVIEVVEEAPRGGDGRNSGAGGYNSDNQLHRHVFESQRE